MTFIFPDRGKIDKAQFILDISRLVLKLCNIATASLNCKMLRFFSLSFSRLRMRTPFIPRILKIELSCRILWPKNFRWPKFYVPQWQKYWFLHINEGPMRCWTRAMQEFGFDLVPLKMGLKL